MSRTSPAERRWAAALAALASAGCGFPLSTLETASPSADRVAWIAMVMMGLAALVFGAVCIVVALSARRNRDRDPRDPDLTPRGHGWVIWGGAVVPALILTGLFVLNSTALGHYPLGEREAGPVVRVIGHQWWWEIHYTGTNPQDRVTTANEIHIPVGRPIRLELTSSDVIHSFWVPDLHGKLDLIPGDTNYLRLTASRPGRYLGRCAEYCGMQHAHMGFVVVAEEPAEFDRWLVAQRAPAAPPRDTVAAVGQKLVVEGPCAMCHMIRGTPAKGQVAPDLTHFGSRLTLAAGSYPNTTGFLEAWITNAQSLKPGAKMPSLTQFDGVELRAMTMYLQQLR